jgi:hypothetical protein
VSKPCVDFVGYHDRDGYGQIGRKTKAHRQAFLNAHGWLPKIVMHTCDNPSCIEPTHLVAGSPKENTADMMAKGRAKFAGRCLTLEQVADVRRRVAAGEIQRAIARELKVHPMTINRIVRGRSWKGVT